MEDIVSQQENTLAAVNDQLTTARQDNQQLRFQLDDTLRRAADERERSVMHATSVVIMQQCCYHYTRVLFFVLLPYNKPTVTLLLHSVCTLVCVQLAPLIPHCSTTSLVLFTSQ